MPEVRPPFFVRVHWANRSGQAFAESVFLEKSWDSLPEARKGVTELIASKALQGVAILERPTEELVAKGITSGPVYRNLEVCDSTGQAVAAFRATIKTMPLDPSCEALLSPVVKVHFRELDAKHGPWKIMQVFKSVTGGEPMKVPMTKPGEGDVWVAQLAQAMQGVVAMVQNGILYPPGQIVKSGRREEGAGLPDGTYLTYVEAKGLDGFDFRFPEAPEIEDANN